MSDKSYKQCNKYLIKVMILKVFPFESEVGQECYYYHLYHYCTADPGQTTETRVVSRRLQDVTFILSLETLNTWY